MLRIVVRIVASVLPLILAGTVAAGGEDAGLGSLDFPNSGAPGAQEAFLRGVLLLHSFEYDDAREVFQEAQRVDPAFALAYWGEALTHDHPLWAEEDAAAARAALAKLAPTAAERLARAPTERERGLLEAVEVLFGEGDKDARDRAYSERMRRLHEAFPDDLEIAAFYALSILGTVRDRDFATYMRAGSVVEEVFARNPRHPGAAHYLIHSYDDPIHAPLGLRAAAVYAQIAPAAAHAQHMISHIYTALGMWDEVVDANRKSFAVSEDRLRRKELPLHRRGKHALFWLEYALLQEGRFDEARQAMAIMAEDAGAGGDETNLWHYAHMRAAMIVAAPAASEVPPARDLPGVAAGAVAADAFATALRAAALGDLASARAAIEALRSVRAKASSPHAAEGCNLYGGSSDERDLDLARVLELEAEGLLRFAEGKTEKALALLAEASAAEEARPLEFGPPEIVKPTHELLGEILLAIGRPAEAQEMFEAALARAPRRTLSLLGLARAAAAAGDVAAAAGAWTAVREIWKGEEAALAQIPGAVRAAR